MITEHISVYNMPLLPPVQDASQVIWTTNGATKLQMRGKLYMASIHCFTFY
jgi:hypothetical protein